MKIFSGIQPTGKIHIGNYLGALKQWAQLQEKNDCIYCIADLHSITIDYDPKLMPDKILETAADMIAIGVNPEKSPLFVQSQALEHTQLTWIFNTITSFAELQRMTQFKDKALQHKENVNVGLFDYPVLQAADILLYKAEGVPVGEDQLQHVELASGIARRFNQKYGQTFPELKAILNKDTARIMGLDNPEKKMSKSLGERNFIAISDTKDEITRKIAGAPTDTGKETEISAGTMNLLKLVKLFAGNEAYEKFHNQREMGIIKYSELKPFLVDAIDKELSPIREKREQLLSDKEKLKEILAKGAEKLRPIAQETMTEVYKKMGLR